MKTQSHRQVLHEHMKQCVSMCACVMGKRFSLADETGQLQKCLKSLHQRSFGETLQIACLPHRRTCAPVWEHHMPSMYKQKDRSIRDVNGYYSRQDRQKNRVKLAAKHRACTPRRLGITGAAQDAGDGSLHSDPTRNTKVYLDEGLGISTPMYAH